MERRGDRWRSADQTWVVERAMECLHSHDSLGARAKCCLIAILRTNSPSHVDEGIQPAGREGRRRHGLGQRAGNRWSYLARIILLVDRVSAPEVASLEVRCGCLTIIRWKICPVAKGRGLRDRNAWDKLERVFKGGVEFTWEEKELTFA